MNLFKIKSYQFLCLLCLLVGVQLTTFAQKNQKQPDSKPEDSLQNLTMPGLKFRSIGPAITEGRVTALAVNPNNPSEYYVASGHGSLWKTINHGTTYFPVFDGQSSFAMGAVAIDPNNSHVVWAGTGENNNQTNVIYGDGVYKSEDGGQNWANMGLKSSEHIGGIAISQENSNVVYVAAYGPSRREGGDRGIFKTVDGGKTWRNTLNISPYTGCYEVHIHPKQHNIVYAVSHQRMRKNHTVVRGGNESAIYRSTDYGETWEKIMKGLPTESVGRIGMAISPANPDVMYALVEAATGSGFYRSGNRGVTWTKQSDYNSAYPFYMQKIVADPRDENKVYSMDLLNQVTLDGGKTFNKVGEQFKHVDNHCMWIDPQNTEHLLSGCDGGVYESWDMGKSWSYNGNLPICEVYKVSTDNVRPFYNVYIGTQDNNSLMGPSRTLNSSGITNRDWTFTLGGDGFETQVDWKDPNILYAQSQNGGLARYDKKSGERLSIQPVSKTDTAYRFDWDSPLLISKHNHKRLYFAANVLFKTEDYGNTWEVISPDLTRGVPQKMDRLMDRSWSVDELAFKSHYANITAIAESPLNPDVLMVGTGDGLIHYTLDGGKSWTASQPVKGLPERARIHQIIASRHNVSVAYTTCHAVNEGDYKPYILKTTDGGKTWNSLASNLPERGSTYSVAEDHVNANLLFVGTQFGLYTSIDAGSTWVKFMNGLPASTYIDLEIQTEHDDLVVASFGRGIYILDDYSPLRQLNSTLLKDSGYVFPIRTGLMYTEASPMGYSGKGFQGGNFYSADNPEVGVGIKYYLRHDVKKLKETRREEEKAKQKKNEDLNYPDYNTLLAESQQGKPQLLFVITNSKGEVVRKLTTNIKKGLNRITWDMRTAATNPVSLQSFDASLAWASAEQGFLVEPGTYSVQMVMFDGFEYRNLANRQWFEIIPLNHATLTAGDKAALDTFNRGVAEMIRLVEGADQYRSQMSEHLKYLQKGLNEGAVHDVALYKEVQDFERKLNQINKMIRGDGLRSRYEGAAPVSLRSRVNEISESLWATTSAPTTTFIDSYTIVNGQIDDVLNQLKEATLTLHWLWLKFDEIKLPYTPGSLPER